MAMGSCERKVQKQLRHDSQQMLASIEAETPTKGIIAKTILEQTPTKAERLHSKPEDLVQNYPESYRTLLRFPRKAMKAWLISRSNGALTEKVFASLKVRDAQIVAHMFEFETGLELSKPWPQGPCHEIGMLEQILDKWLEETSGFIKNVCGNADWCKQGRFQYLPVDEEVKTSVFDTRTGKTADIPTSIRVDHTWSIHNNWSGSEAMLADESGCGYCVSTVYNKAGVEGVTTTNSQWVEFAEEKAKGLATKPSQETELTVPALLGTLSRELHTEAGLTPLRMAAGEQSPVAAAPRSPLEEDI